jgi:very-short-patch-repair endonuclease
MTPKTVQPSVWALVKAQHGVLARGQLLELGFSAEWIRHRLATGRLHRVWRGVYAVGRPQLTQPGRWMAAALACGPDAVLSHTSAAALWEIRARPEREIHISVPARTRHRRPGIVVHRRATLDDSEVTSQRGIPTTTPIATLIDIAPSLTRDHLEAAINEADRRGLANPDQLRSTLDDAVPRPGTAIVRKVLDERTFTRTDSHLERRFLRLARKAGLPEPLTQHQLNGFKVDFYWSALRLVVETDGLTYHRTPAQQTADRLRDQAHIAAGLTTLRFTHAQVAHDPQHVRRTLAAMMVRQAPGPPGPRGP